MDFHTSGAAGRASPSRRSGVQSTNRAAAARDVPEQRPASPRRRNTRGDRDPPTHRHPHRTAGRTARRPTRTHQHGTPRPTPHAAAAPRPARSTLALSAKPPRRRISGRGAPAALPASPSLEPGLPFGEERGDAFGVVLGAGGEAAGEGLEDGGRGTGGGRVDELLRHLLGDGSRTEQIGHKLVPTTRRVLVLMRDGAFQSAGLDDAAVVRETLRQAVDEVFPAEDV
jgi:hypothetical protein